jgi:hypothetical protein
MGNSVPVVERSLDNIGSCSVKPNEVFQYFTTSMLWETIPKE